MNHGKREIFYSICILIAIPAIIIANTVILTLSTNEAFKTELQRKADYGNSIIAQSSLKLLENKQYDVLQNNLDSLEDSQPSLMQSMIIVKDSDALKIVARSSSAPESLNQSEQNSINFAYNNKNPIAFLINTFDRKNNPAQAWSVTTPVLDGNNKVIAIVSSSLLTVDAQEAINSAYQKSFIILVVSIILIMGLLFRHFRLVGYIKLLAKQRELNQTMNDFLSVATHELKSPTSIIKGYLSNVLDGDFGPVEPKIREQIQIAVLQTDRLNALVQDLLNVSRVDQGKIQYNLGTVDTTKILNTIIENYRPIAENKGLQVIYNPDANLPLVYADEGRVQEVFSNLIDNAIKYTPKGSVTITQQINKDRITTNFRDTGLGMSPTAKQRLFQRFYRIKTDKTQGISGTGLGLWIIKQYVVAMNGSIEVETMEGVGSNFIVELPIES